MIIALCGCPRSGKDEVARYIISKYENTCRYAFADPIREMLCAMFRWKIEDFDNDSKDFIDPFWKVSKREMLEYFGERICKNDLPEHFPLFKHYIGNNIWVKRFEQFYKSNNSSDIIITDLRFKPEYEFLMTLPSDEVRIVRLFRFKTDNVSKLYDIPIFGIDYSLVNDASLEEFHSKIDQLYISIKGE